MSMAMPLVFTIFTMIMFIASARPVNIGESPEVYDITLENKEVVDLAKDSNIDEDHELYQDVVRIFNDLALLSNANGNSCAGKGKSCAPDYLPKGTQCCEGLTCVAVIFGVGGWCA
ncbi:uncharacterized protein LOC112343373 [Selaginella moellendorffii]|uniref:uncharacterized protein LOC112343373 n=1 Tax=Selaginella moellendorffii TaxID=88036 RepID=UPI000D1C82E7|nr:uncharacterized protein LOC112343373 [Selaginella moellendorffii]|eukprot:XP_024522483.1 uncharacterized protein LOC112343373 [Selaginella moellendorffii]